MVSAENCSVLSWDKQPRAYGRQNCWLCGLSFGERASCFHISAKYVFLKDTSFQPLQWARLPSARSWILDFTPLPASFQLLPPEPGDVLMAAAGRKAESERLGAGVSQVSPHSSAALSERCCCWQRWGSYCWGWLLSMSSLHTAESQKEWSTKCPWKHLHQSCSRRGCLRLSLQGNPGSELNECPHVLPPT